MIFQKKITLLAISFLFTFGAATSIQAKDISTPTTLQKDSKSKTSSVSTTVLIPNEISLDASSDSTHKITTLEETKKIAKKIVKTQMTEPTTTLDQIKNPEFGGGSGKVPMVSKKDYWYWVTIEEGTNINSVIGSSKFDENELIFAMQSNQFIILENLVYQDDEGAIKSLQDLRPNSKILPRIIINSKTITRVAPFSGDPRL